jgi:hypothetical protein
MENSKPFVLMIFNGAQFGIFFGSRFAYFFSTRCVLEGIGAISRRAARRGVVRRKA